MKLSIGITGTRGIPNNYGGFEQFAQYLSAGLVHRGHSVSVYCSSTHPYKQSSWNGVQLIHCKDPEHKFGTIGQFLYDRNCLNDARRKNFDILLHLGYTSDSVWHKRWPRQSVNIMNMDGLEWKRSKYNGLTRRFLKKAEALAADHADILVADSLAIQQYLLKEHLKNSFFIPYGAKAFNDPDPEQLQQFNLVPNSYFLAIARMEPENNIEMIIQGYLDANSSFPLVLVGSTATPFGKKLLSRYKLGKIIFTGGLFDENLLNNLRYHSQLYFHGHSVGGTNPSLLEAMACSCNIAVHDNEFNRAITGNEADYFSASNDITRLISGSSNERTGEDRKRINLHKINTIYSYETIINSYESMMVNAVTKQK